MFLVFYGLVSTLPLYAKDTLYRTDEEAGLLMTVFLFSAILVRPFTGIILDRFGKRNMLWISLFAYLLCTGLYLVIKPFEGLLLLRFFQGIWFSIATTATGSLAADHVPLNRRGAGLGYFAMSTNLAVVLGPFIALFVIQTASFTVLFVVLSVLMIIGALSSLTIKEAGQFTTERKKFVFSIDTFFERKAIPIAIIGCLLSFSYASILSYLSIYAQIKGLLSVASLFFVVFAAVMLITRPFTGKIFDEKGPVFIIVPGFLFFILGLLLLAKMTVGWQFLLAASFVGLGYGAIVPSLQALAVQSTSPGRSGYATATFFTFFDTGLAIGSYVLGVIAIYSSYEMVYVISSAGLVVVLSIYIFLEKRKRSLNQ